MTKPRTGHSMTIPARAGIGLRGVHHEAVIATRPSVGFFEAHAENYMGGGAARHALMTVRQDWPVSLHGVGLSLGSVDGLDAVHLERLAELVERVEPCLVSEHLAWSVMGGVYLNDLLPLPYTEESLAVVARNVDRLQSRLKRRVLIENPSTYLRYSLSTLDEPAFLAALAKRTGCALLCDVNNLYVNRLNHGSDPLAALDALPADAVAEIHLAGHCVNDADGLAICIDDHGSAVSHEVWRLYEAAVHRFPTAAALVEWDTDIPALDVLVAEAEEADRRRNAVFGKVAQEIFGRGSHVHAA
ncbi:MAG: DUF692 domain-containing protein [Candidatus Eiseniibacteriota bacterium]